MMAKKRRSRYSRELPTDILFYNILPRLPAKSLLRFTCVSKEWQKLLKTPWFHKLHLHHAINDHHQNHHKLLAFSTKTPKKFNTIDCQAPEDGFSTTRRLPFKVSHNDMTVVASFGGLVCVGLIIKWTNTSVRYSHLILWNPLTGDYKTLSKTNARKKCYTMHGTFCLYYSSCDDDYRLLRVTYRYAYIYSLKSDSWRKVHKKRRISECCSTTVLNEKIYLLNNVHSEGVFKGRLDDSITMFDTKTEKFTVISTPSIETSKVIFCVCFTVLKGCIHLYLMYRDHYRDDYYCRFEFTELWRMDGDGDWTKVGTYRKPDACAIIFDQPLHLTRNGELLAYSTSKGCLCKLVLAYPIYIKEMPWSFTPGLCFYIPPSGKYVETLVSPNRR